MEPLDTVYDQNLSSLVQKDQPLSGENPLPVLLTLETPEEREARVCETQREGETPY